MKTRLILLAAGNSRRFGSNKLLYKIDGNPMFLYALRVMEELLNLDKERELYVVTRFHEVMKAVEELKMKPQFSDRVHVVNSPDSEKGISYSIKSGLLANEKHNDYYLFMVSDQPNIKVDTVEKLINNTLKGHYIGGCVAYDNIMGNPVIFSEELKDELLELQGDKGGKPILKKYSHRICKVNVSDPIELVDKDTLDSI